MMNFKTKITNWRVKNGYTQDKMADICKISVRTVQTWERGERLPGFDSLILIANTMGVSIDWLCGRSDYQQTIETFINGNLV